MGQTKDVPLSQTNQQLLVSDFKLNDPSQSSESGINFIFVLRSRDLSSHEFGKHPDGREFKTEFCFHRGSVPTALQTSPRRLLFFSVPIFFQAPKALVVLELFYFFVKVKNLSTKQRKMSATPNLKTLPNYCGSPNFCQTSRTRCPAWEATQFWKNKQSCFFNRLAVMLCKTCRYKISVGKIFSTLVQFGARWQDFPYPFDPFSFGGNEAFGHRFYSNACDLQQFGKRITST